MCLGEKCHVFKILQPKNEAMKKCLLLYLGNRYMVMHYTLLLFYVPIFHN